MEMLKKLRRNDHLPFQMLDGEVVVVDPKTQNVHVLNSTASRIWELLENDMDLQGLIDALNEEYDLISPERVQEVRSFLNELEEQGLTVSEREEDAPFVMR